MITSDREVVVITKIIRRMRGGSQSYLVEAEDGHFYVAKFLGNPQGSRTLINEWVVWHILQYLNVNTPVLRVLDVSEEVQDTGAVHFVVGNNRMRPHGTLHLGSRCPVDPARTAIFDFLPTRLLPQVTNLQDFATAFVADTWLHQTDKRQAIFIRENIPQQHLRFRAYLIDHGMSFAGSRWELADAPYYARSESTLYSLIDMTSICVAAVTRIREISERDLSSAAANIPSQWFSGEDQSALAHLFSRLLRRRDRLEDLLLTYLKALQG